MSTSERDITELTLASTSRRHGQSPYWSLDSAKDEIRLLTILPPSPTGEDVIHCTLSQMPLRDAPAYEALSYTWADEDGDSSLSATIILEGHPFQVTKNLEAALRQLRLTRDKRVFWIDAVCIDQKNDPERSHQVGMMGVIYEKASEVAIWLGSERESSHFAFLFLHGALEREDAVEWTQRILAAPEIGSYLGALILVLLKEYWNRIWIIQEVISAREKMIYCGSDSISWNGFNQALSFISNQCWHTGSHRVADPLFTRVIASQSPRDIEAYRKLWIQEVPNIFAALRSFRIKASGDPRDKVYGIIGLTTARNDPMLPVDYSLTVGEVYVNVVRYVVSTSQRLDIINIEKARLHPDWLPSWVPDWSYENDEDNPVLQKSFNAALNEPAEALFESSGRVLRVQGIITGTIEFAAVQADPTRQHILNIFSYEERPGTRGYRSQDFYFLLFTFCDWYTLAMARANYETITQSAFYQTIFSGNSLRTAEGLKIYFEIFAAAITHYMPDYPIDGLLGDVYTRFKNEGKYEDVRDFLAMGSEFFSHTAHKMSGKRLFVCSEGRMGVAPYRAELGDLVCVLFGCSRPVILRPQGGHYIVIGSAFVRGLMDGEAIEGLSSGKYKKQEFELH